MGLILKCLGKENKLLSGCLPGAGYWNWTQNTLGCPFLLSFLSSSFFFFFTHQGWLSSDQPLWLLCVHPTFTADPSCCFPQHSNTGVGRGVKEVWSTFKQISVIHNCAEDDKWLTREASGAAVRLRKDVGCWIVFFLWLPTVLYQDVSILCSLVFGVTGGTKLV